MGGDALEGQAEPEGALVSDQRCIRGRLRHNDRAGTSKNSGAREMKCALAANFLPRSNDKDRAAGAFQLFGHVTDRRDESCYAAFHVRRAAAVHLAIDDLAGKRINTPWRVSKRNRIDMAGKAQRRLAADTSCPCNQIGAIRSEFLQRRLQPGAARIASRCHMQLSSLPGGLIVLKAMSSRESSMGSIRMMTSRLRLVLKCIH